MKATFLYFVTEQLLWQVIAFDDIILLDCGTKIVCQKRVHLHS